MGRLDPDIKATIREYVQPMFNFPDPLESFLHTMKHLAPNDDLLQKRAWHVAFRRERIWKAQQRKQQHLERERQTRRALLCAWRPEFV